MQVDYGESAEVRWQEYCGEESAQELMRQAVVEQRWARSPPGCTALIAAKECFWSIEGPTHALLST